MRKYVPSAYMVDTETDEPVFSGLCEYVRADDPIIAAAPELLAALYRVIAECNCALDYVGVDDAHTLQRVLNRFGKARKVCEDAIAKAEGRE